ncbi:MAG: hypothetical protein ACOY5W_17140 [Pseudomonadota bacterium]
MSEQFRSRALDSWDYARPFARFHIRWFEGDITPAFDQTQALGIAMQELGLSGRLEVWAQRAVLVTFSSQHVAVGGRPAEREPAWVVILAGVKTGAPGSGQDPLGAVAPGGGAVVQCLLHARSGELLLGTAIPVTLRAGG